MIVVLDFETYYDSKDYTLSKMGPIEYIRDPRFTALCLGYCINDDDTIVVEEPDIASTLQKLRLEDEGTYVVGHNIAGFDALILSERYGIHPKNIVDTMHLARWCGISRVIAESHKALTDFLGHGVKQAGTVVSNGKRTKEDFTPEDWAFFKQYCADDVTQCSLNFFSMVPYIPMHAIKFGSLTARMATEPVIQIDAPMIEQYVRDIDRHAEEIMADLNAEFHFASREEFLKAIRSAPTFCSMLARYGATPPMKLSEAKTKTRKTQLFNAARSARNNGLDDSVIVKAMDNCEVYAPALSKNDLDFRAMANDPNEHVAALVQARLELNSSIEKSRAVRLLEMSKSGRPLPVMLKAFYAHTGRYGAGSSEGSDALNMQNMSKRDPSKLTLRRALQAPAGHKFVSVDSSQIEARMLAYLAGETELVGHFREGRDPYAELAEKIFSVPAKEIHDGAKGGDKRLKNYRNVGKTCILSCFAGDVEVLTDMGWKRIDSVSDNDKLWDGETWQTHDGLICNGRKNTINLAGINVTPDHLIFDGSSWRTAEEYQREPSCLNRALSIGDAALLIAQSNQDRENPEHIISWNANHAVKDIGRPNIASPFATRSIVSIVRLVIAGISKVSGRSIQTPNPGQSLANSQCCKATGAYWKLSQERNAMSVCAWFNALVGRSLIGSCNRIFGLESQQDVMLAPRRKHGQHKTRSIGAMRTFALTYHRDDGCLQGLLHKSIGAITRMISTMKAMAAGVSSFALPAAGIASPTLSLCPAGTTRISKSTGLTTMETMKSVISDSFLERKTSRTVGASTGCSSASTNLKQNLVYDIRNVGPNHRYMVRTKLGALLVHNCGYGVGWKKFSDTLLRQGVMLDKNLASHEELAKSAHQIYRMSNRNIVAFWDMCQRVIEALERGVEGWFGGSGNDVFRYMHSPLPGKDEKLPCVRIEGPRYNLWYPNLHWEKGEKRVEYFYDRIRGKNTIKTKLYGGSLCENVTQSIAFMLLMWQANMIDDLGIHLVANIHDAWIACVPEKEAEATKTAMEYVMSTVPPWLAGFPVACEGEIGDSYEIA